MNFAHTLGPVSILLFLHFFFSSSAEQQPRTVSRNGSRLSRHACCANRPASVRDRCRAKVAGCRRTAREFTSASRAHGGGRIA